MINRIFLFVLAYAMSYNAQGQIFKMATSEAFPEKLGYPVLFMKNGYTIFANDDIREKTVILKVFDSNKNMMLSKPLELKELAEDFKKRHYAKMDVTIKISSWKEENDKIVLYLLDNHYQGKYNNEMKYKIIIDPKTLLVEAEKTMSDSENSAFYFSTVTDKKTNNYFVQEYFLKKKGEERGSLTFSYYSADGKKLGVIPFDYLGNTETKVDVTSWRSLGNEKAGAIALVSNDKKNPKMIFSVYDFATNKLTNKILFDVPDDYDVESTELRLVPNTNILNVVYYIKTGAKSGKVFYQIVYQNIDFSKMEFYKTYTPAYEKLDDFVKTKCGIKKGYDGGFVYSSIIDEKGNMFNVRVKNVVSIYGKNVKTLNPELVGVSYCDINGKELNAWAFSYNNSGSVALNSATGTSQNDFSFKTICNKKGNFLILNDSEKNINVPLSEKAAFARITDECNAMVVSFTQDGQIKKDFLFGAPENKKTNKYADLANAIYDERTNTLITIYYEGEGYKNNKVAWINLD